MSLYLGIDVGSSSVKTAIFDADKGVCIGRATMPSTEQPIDAPHPGWAEQDPEMWWTNFLDGYSSLVKTNGIDTKRIAGIGISYQMHGLVLLDDTLRPLRKSIIWCDSRAVETGRRAFEAIGKHACLSALLNSPGNFTAAKLGWVKDHEARLFEQVKYFMLPGDYFATRLTGQPSTTLPGLSEGIFVDFRRRAVSDLLLSYFGFDPSLVAPLVPPIGDQGTISPAIATLLNLRDDVKILYRAGDQPNNAFSLNVIAPGDVAATAGTSGVIYAVTDEMAYDPESRINTFMHVTDTAEDRRNGILICVNGTGILYSWLRRLLSASGDLISYERLNALAADAPPGADDLLLYPYGNGAERILGNRRPNASIENIDFNRHAPSHVTRAALEGIVYALNVGFEILRQLGVQPATIRAGNANLFLSETFRSIFANVTGTPVELFDTDGSEGAARGAALGGGFYSSPEEAFQSLTRITRIDPDPESVEAYGARFASWSQQMSSR